MKLFKSQSGSSAVALLLVVIVLCVLGFVGWKVYDANKTTKPASSTTSTVSVPNDEPRQEQPKIPEGFIEYKNEELGFKFAYPKEWGDFEQRDSLSSELFSGGFSGTKADNAVTGQPGYNVGFYAKTGKEGIGTRGGALWDCVGFVLKDQKYTCRNIYVKDGVAVEQNNSVFDSSKLVKGRNTDIVVASFNFFGQPVFEALINLNGKYYGGVFVTDSSNQTLVKQLEQVSQTIELL